jgi:hypothetical protein
MSPAFVSSHGSTPSLSYIWIESPAPPFFGAPVSPFINAGEQKQHKASSSTDYQMFSPVRSAMLGTYNPGWIPTIEPTSIISSTEERRRISRTSLLVKCAQPPAVKKVRHVIDELEGGWSPVTGCSCLCPSPRNLAIRSKL